MLPAAGVEGVPAGAVQGVAGPATPHDHAGVAVYPQRYFPLSHHYGPETRRTLLTFVCIWYLRSEWRASVQDDAGGAHIYRDVPQVLPRRLQLRGEWLAMHVVL
jgi:hypothetical protein